MAQPLRGTMDIWNISSGGTKKWYVNNRLHREDGPAYESAEGPNFYYLNGKCLTLHEFITNVVTDANSYENYREYKVRVFYSRTEWWLGHKLHRENGPAIIFNDGTKFWYFYGIPCSNEDEYDERRRRKIR
jgi:hypothetical protein